jgi:preprotein translocase subunit SecG
VLETGLIVFHVVACVVLVTLVLMQQGRGADAGAALGAGASSSVFGARGSATFLSRGTAAAALFLLATSLGLNALYVHRGHGSSVTERYPTHGSTPPAPAAPQIPRKPDAGHPAAPAAGDEPQGQQGSSQAGGSAARPLDIPSASEASASEGDAANDHVVTPTKPKPGRPRESGSSSSSGGAPPP